MNRIVAAACAGLLGLGLIAAEGAKFATGEWEPYTGHKMEGLGVVSEIVTAACRAGGLEAEYAFFPWKRAEANVEAGTHFATFPYQETKARAGKFYFSETLYKSSSGILLHKGNPKTAGFAYSRAEDLRGLTVGIIAGSDAIRLPLQQLGISVEEVQTVDQNIEKLNVNRLDCLIDDKPVVSQALKKAYGSDTVRLNQFHFTKKGFGGPTEYKLLVSMHYPNAKALLEKFNAGLKKIKASGEYQKILKKFGL